MLEEKRTRKALATPIPVLTRDPSETRTNQAMDLPTPNAGRPASGTNQQQTISDLMAEMAEAGAPFAAIQIAVRAIEFERGKEAARKAKRADEKRNQRAKKTIVSRQSPDCRATNEGQSQDMSADVSPDKPASESPSVYINHARADGNPCSTSLRSVEINSPLPTVDPQGGPRSRKSEVVSILTECLSAQTANDLVAHRKSLKAPLTEGAARRLVKQLVESGNPEAAVSQMLARGWKGFQSDWMKNQTPRAGPAKSNRNGFAALAREIYGSGNGTGTETRVASQTLLLLPNGDVGGSGRGGDDAWSLPRKAGDGFG